MRSRSGWILSLTLVAWLLVLAPAHAYIDPGTTGYVFSLLVAFFAAAGMTLKLFWRRITGFFRRDEPADAPRDDEASGGSDDAERVTEQA